ncbi:hypothetical protein [uncultured Methanobrevibacter sp.]|uniref:hypothetical protein n=1 Tax=uncultured Methanobrevibacter sp. TaxID=253161 RepID=UPI00262F96D7|nr:hypothetical protein [uncultured Methanobrevibacter sp.]
MIDFEIEDVVVLDESRCQNTTNTARRLYNPIFNGKTDKNRIKKVVRDTELMVLVYRELTANQQYFSTKKTTPIISC